MNSKEFTYIYPYKVFTPSNSNLLLKGLRKNGENKLISMKKNGGAVHGEVQVGDEFNLENVDIKEFFLQN